MMKEWRAWEYLVMRTIIGLERVTKDSEMKWVVTKGNENLSIMPLSVRATLHPDAPAALELLIARTRVLDYL